MTKQGNGQGMVRAMKEHDLARVLEWRNAPEVRRHMYTQHEIPAQEHRAWFERVSVDPARHLLIFEIEATPLGYVNFHAASHGRVADWGFYLSPQAPPGTGQKLGRAALNHAFGSLGLHKVCGEALATNERSVRFHLKLGFRQEGVLRDQHFDGSIFHTVIRFGLLRPEWNPPDCE